MFYVLWRRGFRKPISVIGRPAIVKEREKVKEKKRDGAFGCLQVVLQKKGSFLFLEVLLVEFGFWEFGFQPNGSSE